MPNAIEWIKIDSLSQTAIDRKWIKNVLKTSFISLGFALDLNTIIAKNNSLEFLCEEDRKLIAPFVKTDSLIYHLKDKSWEKVQY